MTDHHRVLYEPSVERPFDLVGFRAVAKYLCVCERTARSLAHREQDPIPVYVRMLGRRTIVARSADLAGWLKRNTARLAA